LARLVLPDRLGAVSAGVAGLLRQHDLVITCGGLGPTQDDVTRQACARALKVPLEFKPAAWLAILARFRRFNRPCTENNRIQAMVPRGAEVLANPHGTAPGFFYAQAGKMVAALPGPPRELVPMLEKQLGPRLRAQVPAGVPRRLRRVYRVCGVGESELQAWLGPLSENPAWPELGFLLDEPGEILVILTAREASGPVAQKRINLALREIKALLGPHFVGDARETLPQHVGKILGHRRQTLAVAESCTGGLVSRRLTGVAGASQYFLEGAVTYSNAAKVKRLQVPPALLTRMGAVSEPVALAMARGIRLTSGADWGLATTGIAGPGGGSRLKPVGTVCLAIAGPGKTAWVKTQRFLGEREFVQRRAASTILDELRRRLLESKSL
jgi:nicotinamide-nucleotide amidase